MPKVAKSLKALAVSRLVEPGLHPVGNVAGLHLNVTSPSARSWILRTMVGGKRREIGLGSYPAVSLADVIQKAVEVKDKIKLEGLDPVEQKRAARSRLKAEQNAGQTFEECALAYIKAHEPGWKNKKHVQQWRNTLEQYAYPVIGKLQVRHVEQTHILAILEPIWIEKTETASRLRGRLELVLDWAIARGYRPDSNPAQWRGRLDKLLPKPTKVAKIEHHAAVGVDEVGAFLSRLRAQEGIAPRALEFAVLTAARSGEVRGATWDEIDLEAAVWTIPGERMKAGNEHRVPLSPTVVRLLKALPHIEESKIVFMAPRGGVLSDMSLLAVMRRMGVDAVPHGFRSTFRDWAAERTSYPREVAEMALAHTLENKVEAAYRRGDLFEKRRHMMDAWARFCAAPTVKGAVIPMKKKSRA